MEKTTLMIRRFTYLNKLIVNAIKKSCTIREVLENLLVDEKTDIITK